MAEESTAINSAPEEKLEVPEVPMSAVMVTIEPPDSVSAVVTGDKGEELVLQEVDSEVSQAESDDFVIVDRPVSTAGFVKRWTRMIVGWVRRIFKWSRY